MKLREAAVRASVAKLDVSQEVKDILVSIWREVDGAYAEQVRDLKARLKAVRERMRHAVHSNAISLSTANELRAVADTRIKKWRKP